MESIEEGKSKVPSRVPDAAAVLACYQPVLALDTRRIIGYEVLGREREGTMLRSLGPFFATGNAEPDEQMRIDRLIREQALRKVAAEANAAGIDKSGLFKFEPPVLFINIKPSWMYRMYQKTGELLTLQLLEKYGIEASQVVIEVTEEAFRGPQQALLDVIEVYRREGCRIAVDDVGAGFSNADRIAQIGPELLKVDFHIMRQSATHLGYQGVLRSFSTMAEQIGASLLVEGIETSDDLQRAVAFGARYGQGFLFSQAEPEFQPPDRYAALISRELEVYRTRQLQTERNWRALGVELMRSLEQASWLSEVLLEAELWEPDQLAAPGGAGDALDQAVELLLLPRLTGQPMRVYICRNDGVQLSSNYKATADGWERQPSYRGANWSWRPYFVTNLLALEGREGAVVSQAYTDLESKGRVRTLAAAVGTEHTYVLFVDLPESAGESSC